MISTLIGSALVAAVVISFLWWLAALSRDRRRQHASMDARNDRIAAHYQRNLQKARQLGIPVDDLSAAVGVEKQGES
jgi:Flp pilus assembly protein TadB